MEQVAQDKVTKEILNFLIDPATIAMVAKRMSPRCSMKPGTILISGHVVKLQEAIHKEFGNVKKQQVWRKMLKSLKPPNCRCMKNKWVFNIKHNDVYLA